MIASSFRKNMRALFSHDNVRMLSLSDFFPLKSHTAMPSFNPFDEQKLHGEYKDRRIATAISIACTRQHKRNQVNAELRKYFQHR
jgi:hypothetical protein